jgi:hypothetical protein
MTREGKGACIAVILYLPTPAYQALAPGVGWTAAFNLLKNHDQNSSVQVGFVVPPVENPRTVLRCWLMQKR